ncbi:unnamed protein product [Acanthoscelides obtectus]|uniref:Uncharacterized protein n=1 Tax=Acanthoscelides obtectus TaxID=200917 RepID=A0A9P0PUX7_ACAOB|nr:unnamed protein product [Acanthoscelides obtectus]CAH2007953.1 unnamed protein product [Acanthoscelides obtectus]CAK1652081.1 hypothetical protein AOBTE_LOCUS17667 [Acanthoscelides obtectus]CAK1652096.1 hypothetical protein AOBTE_LOCUS17679 [Acanthoscelides obtectus]
MASTSGNDELFIEIVSMGSQTILNNYIAQSQQNSPNGIDIEAVLVSINPDIDISTTMNAYNAWPSFEMSLLGAQRMPSMSRATSTQQEPSVSAAIVSDRCDVDDALYRDTYIEELPFTQPERDATDRSVVNEQLNRDTWNEELAFTQLERLETERCAVNDELDM